MDSKVSKKVFRRLKKCEETLFKHEKIAFSKHPSHSLFIGNGGLGCGLNRETLMDIFLSYGQINKIVMLLEKPYAFIVFSEVKDATRALSSINGKAIPSGQVFYLSYIQDADVPPEIVTKTSWPEGLILLEDFISEEEENELLAEICIEDNCDKSLLKHRRVKHYGYEFIYGSNNIDKNMPLGKKIPDACIPHLKKLVALGYLPRVPEQLTVNHYTPGQGIPPHIDTHSAFQDGIVSLSLSSQVVMDFYCPQKENISILLPRRSVLIMLGESRYLWKHGITPRKTDVITAGDGSNLTLFHRSPRTSLTFRLIRDGACNCAYKDQCDSQSEHQLVENEFVNNDEAEELEKKYVNQVYEDIADHFSSTRYKAWPKVAEFLKGIAPGSLLLDVGCGNGKNMNLSIGCFEIGCDASLNLAKVCSKKSEVLIADCLQLPFRDNCADVVICIAVIHHMSTKERRKKALDEIVRVLRPKGRALIYVWAVEQTSPLGPSKYLKNSQDNSSHDVKEIALSTSRTIQVPIHVNRNEFLSRDILVPWKKGDNCQKHRYYHIFQEKELESLVVACGVSSIVSSYHDSGNWCTIFEK